MRVQSKITDSEWYNVDYFERERKCMDRKHNQFGKSLVDLCITKNVHMLNGRVGNDKEGNFTYITPNGKSVVDYIICSSILFNQIQDFIIDYRDVCVNGMTHFPLSVVLESEYCVTCRNEPDVGKNTSENAYERMKWNKEYHDCFTTYLQNDKTLCEWNNFDRFVETGETDCAIKCFECIYKDAASMMVVKDRESRNCKTKRNVPWWNNNLERLKRERNAELRKYRKSREEDCLSEYLSKKKLFNNEFKECENAYRKSMYKKLVESKGNSKDFWQMVNKSEVRDVKTPDITDEEWHSYYNELLNQNIAIDQDFMNECEENVNSHNDECRYCNNDDDTQNDSLMQLNSNISEAEVHDVILDMKKGKAPGVDGLVVELFQNSMNIVVPKLCKLYNRILNGNEFPEQWSKAIICSLHKGGDVNTQSNYRGISLLSTCGKVFTKILNKRLVTWANTNDKYHEEQAGYRAGYSTVDQIFSLYTLAEKYLTKQNKRCYVLFVDLSKAFDRIPHLMLWDRLIKIGIHGKVMNILQSMYKKLKSCVRLGNGNRLTEWFDCHIGTRQGCMLSPFLFTMYMNQLIENINDGNVRGIYVTEIFPNVCILCYADDMVNIADTVHQLQKQINILECFCESYGMSVNLRKTKVVVFRRGGCLRKCEKWYYKGEQIECVNVYKYLGLLISCSLKWNKATEQLAQQANKALLKIYQLEKRCGGIPYPVYFNFSTNLFLLFYVMDPRSGGSRPEKMSKSYIENSVRDCLLLKEIHHQLQS